MFKINVLGSQDMTPTKDNDCSHYVLNDATLIDCGPMVVANFFRYGVDLGKIRNIVFTHLHADHCVGIAPLLYTLVYIARTPIRELHVYGPKGTAELIRGAALPAELREPVAVTEIEDGETLQIDGMTLKTVPSVHPARGVCLRFEKGGQSLGFTGDTFFFPGLEKFFENVDALLGEASFCDPVPEQIKHDWGHMHIQDEIRLCAEAGVRSYYMTHCRENRDKRLAEFKAASPTPIQVVYGGDTLEV